MSTAAHKLRAFAGLLSSLAQGIEEVTTQPYPASFSILTSKLFAGTPRWTRTTIKGM